MWGEGEGPGKQHFKQPLQAILKDRDAPVSAGFLPGLFLPGLWLHCEAFQWPLDPRPGPAFLADSSPLPTSFLFVLRNRK